ncbi:MAG: MBL fold metallo-hydrolase [Halorientalis sp.]
MDRIQLTNGFFEGDNNAYLFSGEGPTTLVDTGVAEPDTREQIRDALADHGAAFADVDQVLLTHFHEDHAGLAGEIQDESGATVRVHAADAPLVERDESALAAMEAQRERYFEDWGMPEPAQADLRDVLEAGEAYAGRPATVEPFEGGEQFRAGDETLTAVHLPGHTRGLSGFVRETAGGEQLLSGDALLPVYTPNVGGADTRVEHPLEQYLGTLDAIADADYDRAWPGHRDAIDDPSARAVEILQHHFERTERVLSVLADHGPADAWTVSDHLFGDLQAIHILHGPGEAYAHLTHLRNGGVVERETDGYVLAADPPPLASLFPDRALPA